MNHLPSVYRGDSYLAQYIRDVSDITVRVSVKYVSERRPKTWPGSDEPYPHYSESPKDMLRTGTGWVYRVEKYSDGHDNKFRICQCWQCKDSGTKITQFAHILIRTAAHVVFDNLEGAHTTCNLFFDREGTPDACSGVVTLTGMSGVWSVVNMDLCEMTYMTHDLDLVDRLDKMVRRCEQLKTPGRRPITVSKYTLVIVVSHPHGCSKQISVGRLTDMKGMIDETFIKYLYTSATCCGSSGAPVLVLEKRSLWAPAWWLMAHTHSGKHGELNHSAYSLKKCL